MFEISEHVNPRYKMHITCKSGNEQTAAILLTMHEFEHHDQYQHKIDSAPP